MYIFTVLWREEEEQDSQIANTGAKVLAVIQGTGVIQTEQGTLGERSVLISLCQFVLKQRLLFKVKLLKRKRKDMEPTMVIYLFIRLFLFWCLCEP
jgi:hypothetical protein